uniref:Putative secreted protein n=1 Tax=Ixodes ricinus TaxID=34613 RepID=A0A6B0TYB0_IXORI
MSRSSASLSALSTTTWCSNSWMPMHCLSMSRSLASTHFCNSCNRSQRVARELDKLAPSVMLEQRAERGKWLH